MKQSVLSDCFDDEEHETRTLYFTAPKELVTGRYPEADATDISVELSLNEQEASAARVMFGPVQRDAAGNESTCDWNDIDLSYEDIDLLMRIAEKAM